MSYKIIAQGIEIDFGEDERLRTIVINDEDIKILKYVREERLDLEDIEQAFTDQESYWDQFEDEYLDAFT
tara:strand:- start:81 stop:290 length:210 start_codon:yes stop_codon:yes gene_type:complete